MSACAVEWCVALPPVEAVRCCVHQKYPTLRLVTGTPLVDSVGDPDCSECDGEGDCVECDGDGDCECHCGDQHNCHHCDGSGKCPTCARSMGKRSVWAVNYLRFAFDAGWRPWQPPEAFV